MLKHLEITTVIGCTVACKYCPQGILVKVYRSRETGKTVMTLKHFIQMIDKVPNDVSIHFTGFGEPFLNEDCVKMIKYAFKKGHRLVVSTTLMGLKYNQFERLNEISFDLFAIHLPSKDNLENIVINDEYIKILKYVAENPEKYKLHYHGNELPDELQKLGLSLKFLPVHNRAGNTKLSKIKIEERETHFYPKYGKISCHRIYQNVVLPNGDVVLCCNDYGNKHILGNLLVQSYESILSNRELEFIKKGLNNDKLDILCRKCLRYPRNVNLKSLILNQWIPNYKRKLSRMFSMK